jgi:AP2 domain
MAIAKREFKSPNRRRNAMATRVGPNYGIHRVDDASWRNFAWLVQLRRKNKIWFQRFSDCKYGGRDDAFVAALEYRDAVLAKTEPMSRAEYARIVRKSNRTGIPGVCRIMVRNRAGTADYPYWLAFWPDPEAARKSKRAKFSIVQHGEEQAKRLAIKARKAGLNQLYGARIASRNGAFGGD